MNQLRTGYESQEVIYLIPFDTKADLALKWERGSTTILDPVKTVNSIPKRSKTWDKLTDLFVARHSRNS